MRESLVRLEIACRFLATVFHERPTATFIDALVEEGLAEEWPIGFAAAETRTGVRLMRSFCAAWNEDMLPELEDDFNRLFVGPGHPLAPPWESYYLSHDHLLFQEQTLAVRQAYRYFDLEAPQGSREPDDSLSLELFFMAELCGRCVNTFDAGPHEARGEILEALRQFAQSHILLWAPQCLQLVIEGAKLDYYRAAAFLTLGCLLEADTVFAGLSGGSRETGTGEDGA